MIHSTNNSGAYRILSQQMKEYLYLVPYSNKDKFTKKKDGMAKEQIL